MNILDPNRDPIVWIVNDAGHDFSSAQEYGDLKPLTLDSIDVLRVDRVSYQLSKLARYTQKKDFLLLCGAPILNGLAVHLWLETHGECNTLQWHAKKQNYVLNTLNSKHLKNLLQNAIIG